MNACTSNCTRVHPLPRAGHLTTPPPTSHLTSPHLHHAPRHHTFSNRAGKTKKGERGSPFLVSGVFPPPRYPCLAPNTRTRSRTCVRLIFFFFFFLVSRFLLFFSF